MNRDRMINGILSCIKGAPLNGSIPISWWLNHPKKVGEKLGLVVIQKGNEFYVNNEKVDMTEVEQVADTIILLPAKKEEPD